MVIRLPVDLKSLYLNIKNDNQSGHTATVATPLKQYGSVNSDLELIYEIPENIDAVSREELVASILAKSRTEAKIVNIFVFDKISVNGLILNDVPAFCFYIREEISEQNIHFGRQKLHYPISLKYSDSETEIDNRAVMKAVSFLLKDYAFLVEAFEYDTDTKILNFDALIVGYNNIPYSKVFINQKGVGSKFASVFNEDIAEYDSEIIALRTKLGFDNIGPGTFAETVSKNRIAATNIVCKHLESIGAVNLRLLTEEYPYSLFDYEYKINNRKKYVIVCFTATNIKYFTLPFNKIKFCNDFSGDAYVYLVTDINSSPKLFCYSSQELNKMSKSISSITYRDTED